MKNEVRQWALFTSITGIISIGCYFLAILIPLKGFFWHLNSFSIGVLLGVSLFGLSKIFTQSIFSIVGGLLSLLGGIFMSYMLILQHGLSAYNNSSSSSNGIQAFNYIQLSTDIAFDFFIGIGLIFLCVQMIREGKIWLIVGLIGFVLQPMQIVFNLITFPINPHEKGLLDIGPFAALWLVMIYLLSGRVYLNKK